MFSHYYFKDLKKEMSKRLREAYRPTMNIVAVGPAERPTTASALGTYPMAADADGCNDTLTK